MTDKANGLLWYPWSKISCRFSIYKKFLDIFLLFHYYRGSSTTVEPTQVIWSCLFEPNGPGQRISVLCGDIRKRLPTPFDRGLYDAVVLALGFVPADAVFSDVFFTYVQVSVVLIKYCYERCRNNFLKLFFYLDSH